MSFQVKSSIPSQGYSSLAFTEKHVGALKSPPLNNRSVPYFLGRWEKEGETLSGFKEIKIADKNTAWIFGPAAVANQFFLTLWNSTTLQMVSYDAETLEGTGTTPEFTSQIPVFLQSANGLLFTPKDNCIVAYNPQLICQFSIELKDIVMGTQITLAFTPDQIICSNNSLKGTLSTYDFKGQPTSELKSTKEKSYLSWIVSNQDNLTLVGYYDQSTNSSSVQAWSLEPLAITSPEQFLGNMYLISALNTVAGFLLSSETEVYSLPYPPSSRLIQPFYTYTGSNPSINEITQMDPQTIVTVDDNIKIWKYS